MVAKFSIRKNIKEISVDEPKKDAKSVEIERLEQQI